MNSYTKVQMIAVGVLLLLVAGYLLASLAFPALSTQDYQYLAVALPVFVGLSILSPIFVKRWLRQ